jgi:hypothetical protein
MKTSPTLEMTATDDPKAARPLPPNRPRPRKFSPQFTLGTLLFGMLIAAIFFGYSGLWSQRVMAERSRSSAMLQSLRAELQAEQQAHRTTQARLLIAQSQLRDAGIRLNEQLARGDAAERELQLVEEYAKRLKQSSESAGKKTAGNDATRPTQAEEP